jgi:hypothetical protein
MNNPADLFCAECGAPATQRVTVLVDVNGDPDAARLDSQSYCTLHAATVTEELAHGTPPNAELVSVLAITEAWLAHREVCDNCRNL